MTVNSDNYSYYLPYKYNINDDSHIGMKQPSAERSRDFMKLLDDERKFYKKQNKKIKEEYKKYIGILIVVFLLMICVVKFSNF